MRITDILDQYKIPFVKEREGWINTRCIWCGKDPYFGFNEIGKSCNCWNCGPHNLFRTLSVLTREPDKVIWDMISKLPAPNFTKVKECGVYTPPMGVGVMVDAHRDYLHTRGLDDSLIERLWHVWGIGLLGGTLKWRLYIPIHLRGEVVSWTTRSITPDKEPRYWAAKDNESKVSIKDLLYGIDYVTNSVVICEGPVDVWKIGPGAVALLGQQITSSKMEQLTKIPNRTIVFDNEFQAQRRARKLLADLSVYPGTTRNVTLEEKDPGCAEEVTIETLRGYLGGMK